MLDIQKMRYFIGIVDNDFKLSKASKALNISQPSLSMTIDTLEKEFGKKLLVKEKNKFIDLTAAGEKVYEEGKNLIEHSNAIYNDIIGYENVKGQLKIAIPPVTQPIVTSQVIAQFMKTYPNIELIIYEEGAYIGRNRLIDGELDFGFMTTFVTSDELNSFTVFESDIVCLLRKDHPLTKKDFVSTKDVAQYQMIGLNETFTLYQMIDVYFNNHGSTPNYFYKTSRWDYAVEMVSNNREYDFLAVLPLPLFNIYNNEIMTYRRFNNDFRWAITLSYNKNKLLRSESLIFIEFVKNFFKVD